MKKFKILFFVFFYCLYINCYGQKLGASEINHFIGQGMNQFLLVTIDNILKNQHKTIESSLHYDYSNSKFFCEKVTYTRTRESKTFITFPRPPTKDELFFTNGLADSLVFSYVSMSNEGGYERFSTTYYQYGADSLLTLSFTHNENGIDSVKYTYHWYKPNHIKIFGKYGNYEIHRVNKNLIKYKHFNLSENNRKEELFGEVIIDNNKQVITEKWYMSPLCEEGILDEKSYWFYFTTDFKNGKIDKTLIRTKNGKYRYVIKYNYLD